MKTCIICRQAKETFNEEHVIPDSIGGGLKIKSVCEPCNNRLGTQVDHYLTNCLPVELIRHELGLVGRKGKLPDPLVGPVKVDSNQKLTHQMVRDKEGNLFLLHSPDTQIRHDEKGNPINLSIQIPKHKENELDKLIEKALKRNNIPREAIVSFSKEFTEVQHEPVNRSFVINFPKLWLAIIKIAYEFAATEFPHYLEDEKAVRISRMLENADKFTADMQFLHKKRYLLSKERTVEHFENFSEIIDFNNDNHYLILLQTPKGLMCMVNIFNIFHEIVLLTDNTTVFNLLEMKVLKSDTKTKKAQIMNIQEIGHFVSENGKL